MAVAAKKRPTPNSSGPRNVVAEARTGKARRSKRSLWEAAKPWLWPIAIFLLIRTFLIEAYRIPSGSMEPTLLVGDFLFVNKLIFGPTIPFTNVHLPGYAEPKRGEVVIYTSPDVGDGNPTVVKRLVGVAGDTLYMRAGLLYVNGIAQRQGFAAITPDAVPDEPSSDFEWQRQYGLEASRFGPAPAQPTHDNWGPFVIPPKHIFGLGDSRYNSKDARYYGFVPRGNVHGRPLFLYFSFDWDAMRVRWSRIGQIIR